MRNTADFESDNSDSEDMESKGMSEKAVMAIINQ